MRIRLHPEEEGDRGIGGAAGPDPGAIDRGGEALHRVERTQSLPGLGRGGAPAAQHPRPRPWISRGRGRQEV